MSGTKVWLEDIDALTAWMRKVGAVHARVDNMEVHLGDKPHAVEVRQPLTDAEAAKLFEEEKKRNEAMLFAHVEGYPMEHDNE